MQTELSIGALSERTGVATSALRFYEAEGLIHATRSAGGQRRFARETLRRVSFIRVAEQVGLTLDEIAPPSGPSPRTAPRPRRTGSGCRPRGGRGSRPRSHARAAPRPARQVHRLRLPLAAPLSVVNPGDEVAARGPGPRYVLDDEPARGS